VVHVAAAPALVAVEVGGVVAGARVGDHDDDRLVLVEADAAAVEELAVAVVEVEVLALDLLALAASEFSVCGGRGICGLLEKEMGANVSCMCIARIATAPVAFGGAGQRALRAPTCARQYRGASPQCVERERERQAQAHCSPARAAVVAGDVRDGGNVPS
jgi:hypothetical protein